MGAWPPRRLVVPVRFDGKIVVAVATRKLGPGEAVVADAVRIEQRLASTLPSDAVSAPEALQGTRVVRAMAPGDVFRKGSLAAIPLVRRGAAVTITTSTSGVRVSCRGVARMDGVRGATVPVLVQASGRLVRATVVGSHQVVIEL